MSIFAIPDDDYQKKCENCNFATFKDLQVELERQCASFPRGASVTPCVLKRGRSALKENYFEIIIQAVVSLLGTNGEPRKTRKRCVLHRRIVKGTINQMARECLNIIMATKQLSEILTVLEEQ